MDTYVPKHNQISHKSWRGNPMRQQYFLCHLFRKMNQYCISVSGKSMWISRLAVNLKVKLESICSEVFSISVMTIRCQNMPCFIQSLIIFVEVYHGTNRRLLRTSENELVLLIRLERVTKPSLKSLDSTNLQSERLCTNGGNSRPLLPSREMADQKHSKAGHVIVCKVAKVPWVTAKQVKAFLMLANVNIHESTIRRTATIVCMAELQEESHCSPKRQLLPVYSLLNIKCLMDGWDQNIIIWFKWEALCLEKRTHCIPS